MTIDIEIHGENLFHSVPIFSLGSIEIPENNKQFKKHTTLLCISKKISRFVNTKMCKQKKQGYYT